MAKYLIWWLGAIGRWHLIDPSSVNAGCVTTTSIACDTLGLGLFLTDKELVNKLRIHSVNSVVESPGLHKLAGFRPSLQQLQLCYLNTLKEKKIRWQ